MHPPDDPLTIATRQTAEGEEQGPPQESLVGRAVGRYMILSPLGAGGMGAVYKAYDPELDRAVALKFLRVKRTDAEQHAHATSRLLREAKALAQLSHPNVVAVHDVGSCDGDVFLAMELVEGKTLRQWAHSEKPDFQRALAVMMEAGRGLAAAHRAGIIHRDFKPENVLLGQDGRVRVIDFGLARGERAGGERPSLASGEDGPRCGSEPSTENAVSRDPSGASTASQDAGESRPSLLHEQLTQMGSVLGTPVYMAPEQHLGLEVDARADQYSFCTTLYEVLFGRRPFGPEKNRRALVRLKLRGQVDPPPDNGVPRWIGLVVLRGLSLDPTQRFADMEALLSALATDPDEPQRKRRRALFRLSLWALAVLLTLGGALSLFHAAGLRRQKLCAGAEGLLTGVYDATIQGQMQRAFLAVPKPYVAYTWDRVQSILGEYARSWAQAHRAACEATRLLGTQSEALLDLRMFCLDRRRRELKALVEVLGRPDEESVSKAVLACSKLSPVEDCADLARLEQQQNRAGGSDRTRQGVNGPFFELLDQAEAMEKIGKYGQGLTRAEQALAAAEKLGEPALQARAQLLLGKLYENTGDYPRAERALQEAFVRGLRLDDPEILIGATSRLTGLLGGRMARFEAAQQMGRYAEAFCDRSNAGPLERAFLHNGRGNIFYTKGDYRLALAEYQAGLALAEKRLGPDNPTLATFLNNIANVYQNLGENPQALSAHERARAIWQKALGPEHPNMALSLNNIGIVYENQGNLDRALDHYQRALRIRQATLPADHPLLASSYENLGSVHRRLGDGEKAEAFFDKTLQIRRRSLGNDHPDLSFPLTSLGELALERGRAEKAVRWLEEAIQICTRNECDPNLLPSLFFAQAKALTARREDPRRALELARRAKQLLAKLGSRDTETVQAIEAWLGRHGG